MVRVGLDGELLLMEKRGRGVDHLGWEDRLSFPRWVEVEGTIKIWKRFALLPNISEGQKYTIGRRFTSRDEQGEFIRLGDDQLRPFCQEGEALCEIHVEEDAFWVTTAYSAFINEVKTEKGRRNRISFGDYLVFYGRGVFLRFWFKEREFRPEGFVFDSKGEERVAALTEGKKARNLIQSGDEFAENVGQIGIVISKIMTYLPLQDLKNARLVSHTWEEEASKILKKRSCTPFDFNCKPTRCREMKLFRYSEEMRWNPIPNWSITLPIFGTETREEWDPTRGMPGDKLTSDFDWFLNHPHPIQKLDLDFSLKCPTNLELVMKILGHVQHSVEDLGLKARSFFGTGIDEDPALLAEPPCLPSSFNFIKLHTLRMDWSAKAYSPIPQLIMEAAASPALRTLHLEGSESVTLLFLNNLESFPRLEDISIESCGTLCLEVLLRWNKPLKGLGLLLWAGWEQKEVDLLERLLFKHSSVLASLDLVIPENRKNKMLTLNMPILPQLKRLKVDTSALSNAGMATLLFTGQRRVEYAKHFPVLESITCWWDIEVFWEPFFASGQVCRTVTRVEVEYKKDREEECSVENVSPRVPELARMFPNVWNEGTRFVRKSEDMDSDTEQA